MIALIIGLVLAAPRPSLWVERRAGVVQLTTDLSAFFDAPLQRRLRSGLSTRLKLTVQLSRVTDEGFVGGTYRNAEARWDLWDEKLSAVIEDPSGVRTQVFPSIDAFAQAFGQLDTPIAYGLANTSTVHRLAARMEVNPLSAEDLSRARRWLASPSAMSSLDPLGSGLLGSFVRLFDNLKPGSAERVLTFAAQPFRADRLPKRSPETP